MTLRRSAVVCALLAAACASQPARKPPRVVTPPRPAVVYDTGPQNAEWLEPDAKWTGTMCAGVGARWYRFEIRERSTVAALVLRLGQSLGDVDLALYDDRIVRIAGEHEPIAYSSGRGEDEQIRRELPPGVYYAKVWCFEDRGNANPAAYEISLATESIAPIDEPKRQAFALRESAKGPIGMGSKYRSRWFAVDVRERGTLVAEFHPAMEQGELRFDVRTSADRVLATTRAPQTLRVPVSPGRYYFFLETVGDGAGGSFAFNYFVQPEPKPPVVVEKPAPPPPPPPPAPVPVEAPRSTATPMYNNNPIRVVLGDAEPVAKWYSFRAANRSRVKIDCRCDVMLYRRGSDELVTRGSSSVSLEVDPGEYDVRISTPEPAEVDLKMEIHEYDAGAGFTKKKKKG